MLLGSHHHVIIIGTGLSSLNEKCGVVYYIVLLSKLVLIRLGHQNPWEVLDSQKMGLKNPILKDSALVLNLNFYDVLTTAACREEFC